LRFCCRSSKRPRIGTFATNWSSCGLRALVGSVPARSRPHLQHGPALFLALSRETEVPPVDSIDGYAEETRLHYSGGLTEAGDIESFEAE